MKILRSLALLGVTSLSAFAGGLYLEISQGTSGALLTGRVTSCHEPAKSVVTANLVTIVDGRLQRQVIAVAPVPNQPGTFAISGQLPSSAVVIELGVTNPEFKNYEPKVLIRADAGKVQLATKKHFFSTGPQLADYRQALEGRTTATD
jgi:hypothetical protein